MNIPHKIKKLSDLITNNGGKLFVVGGAVRDWLMGKPPVDFDLLIVGLPIELGLSLMDNPTQVVGNAPVFMWGEFEVAFARKEVQTGKGKHNFTFQADENISVVQDLNRRDVAINAMAWDVAENMLIDPFRGQEHIELKLLHPVSVAFKESPERVLRVASFAARFNFNVSTSFVDMAKDMFDTFSSIPAEQVWRHWVKMCQKSVKPSRWLDVMIETGWIKHFPLISNQLNVPQDPKHHPEGVLGNHVKQVMDMAAEAADTLGVDRVWAITTALLHDCGKITETETKNGHVISPGHAEAGVEPAKKFLQALTAPTRFTERVGEGIELHMRHLSTGSDRAVRRLMADIKHITIQELTCIVMADQSGRHPFGLPVLQMPETMQHILAMAGGRFEPIVKGRHLIEIGLKPSPEFSEILGRAKEAQINGDIVDLESAMSWLRGLKNDRK